MLLIIGVLHFTTLSAQISFIAVGDVLLDRGVRESIEKNNSIKYPFEKVKHIINPNDIAFYNLECPITSVDKEYPLLKRNSFRADPEFTQGLVWGGFNLASLANNHTIDWGKDGLMETIRNLLDNNIATVGAASNQVDAFKPIIYHKDGIYVAFFAVLDFLLEATTFLDYEPYPAYGNLKHLINEIKKYSKLVDNIVVSFHWGEEHKNFPNNRQIDVARSVIDAGADLILGHHPHVLQGIETYKGKLICYSLGSFIFDGRTDNENETFAFQCDFTKNGIENPRLVPVVIKNNRPEVALPHEAERILRNIKKYSNSMNTEFRMDADNIIRINDGSIDFPLWKQKHKDSQFLVYSQRIEFLNSKQASTNFQIPDLNYQITNVTHDIIDNIMYLYTIVENIPNLHRCIAIFPFCLTTKTFLQPSLDINRHYFPWKLNIIDIDNDGKNDLIVGTYKTTKYFQEKENRIFVFNVEKDYIYPKWLGSKIGYDIINFKVFGDATERKNKIKLIQNNDRGRIMVNHYSWNEFGFSFNNTVREHQYNSSFCFDNFFKYDFTLINIE